MARLNDEALYSDFATAIDYKWMKDNVFVKALACLYFTFVILLNSFVFTSKIEEWRELNLGIIVALFTITFILWSYEATQASFEGFKNYFISIENYFDISGLFFVDIQMICFLTFGQQDWINYILCLGVFLSNIRLMFHLSVFSSSFRTMLTVIVNAILQLSSFFLILLFFVLIVALTNYTINKETLETDPKPFFKTLIASYMLMFG